MASRTAIYCIGLLLCAVSCQAYTARICTTSIEEYVRCQRMVEGTSLGKACDANSTTCVAFSCVLPTGGRSCYYYAGDGKEADLAILPPTELYHVSTDDSDLGLEPIVVESFGTNSTVNTVAVVKTSTCTAKLSLKDFTGKNGCFPAYYDSSTYVPAIMALSDSKEGGFDLNAEIKEYTDDLAAGKDKTLDPSYLAEEIPVHGWWNMQCPATGKCFKDEAEMGVYDPEVIEHFFDKACVPGTSQWRVCSSCVGDCSPSDPMAGSQGVLQCLAQVGDIAFTNSANLPTGSDYSLLCPSAQGGGCKPLTSAATCNFGSMPGNSIVYGSLRTLDANWVSMVRTALAKASAEAGFQTLFVGANANPRGVLFSSGMQGLTALDAGTTAKDVLGASFTTLANYEKISPYHAALTPLDITTTSAIVAGTPATAATDTIPVSSNRNTDSDGDESSATTNSASVESSDCGNTAPLWVAIVVPLLVAGFVGTTVAALMYYCVVKPSRQFIRAAAQFERPSTQAVFNGYPSDNPKAGV